MKPALVFCILMCAAALTAQTTAQTAAPARPPASLLPQQFAGWQLKDAVTKSADPVAADEANAPVLK